MSFSIARRRRSESLSSVLWLLSVSFTHWQLSHLFVTTHLQNKPRKAGIMWDSKVGGAATCLSEGTADVRTAVRETRREGGEREQRNFSLISRPDILFFIQSIYFWKVCANSSRYIFIYLKKKRKKKHPIKRAGAQAHFEVYVCTCLALTKSGFKGTINMPFCVFGGLWLSTIFVCEMLK